MAEEEVGARDGYERVRDFLRQLLYGVVLAVAAFIPVIFVAVNAFWNPAIVFGAVLVTLVTYLTLSWLVLEWWTERRCERRGAR